MTATCTQHAIGNRLTSTTNGVTTTYTYDDANQMTAAGSTTYTYDGRGNTTSATTGGQTTAYARDALDRLTSIFGGVTASYTYNGDGLRVKSGTTTFAWDLSSAQMLNDGSDHAWGRGGLIGTVSASGCITYALTDALGSVQGTTTIGGGTPTTKQYDAFGKPLPAPPDPCTPLRIGFAGEQRDAETGFSYLRARYMDPATGRFLSKDPVLGVAGRPQSQNGYTVRQYLSERLCDQEFETLEARLNRLLVARLPVAVLTRPQRLAIDLTLLPYYGREGLEPDQLRRGEAKAGTTRFHCYATAAILHAGRRVTVAVTFVHAEEALLDVLLDLLGRLAQLGVRIRRLFLDREFASVAILRAVAAQPFPTIVALPKRGERLKARLTGRAGSRTTYTMHSAEDGDLTFPLVVACRSAAGRRGQHGREYLPFAVVGQGSDALPVRQIATEYRDRFGIESSYRQMNAVRAPTSSRDPALRLLLVVVALLLTNLWVWLKAYLLAATPPGTRPAARHWLATAFRLDRFRDLLIEGIKARYQPHTALHFPFPCTSPLKL